MVRQIMRIADRYFNAEEAGRARVWPFRPFTSLERRIGVAMVGFLVLINQAQVGNIIVRLNFFNRDLFNAIQNHDVVTFWHQLLFVFTPFAFLYVATTVITAGGDTTCGNWTKSGDGSAIVGHHDRTDLKDTRHIMFSQMLNAAIKVAQRYDRKFSVMFVDLDRFKLINDTLGHAAGDILLKGVASQFRQCLRDSDVSARFGGDEFVICCTKCRNVAQVSAVARRLLSAAVTPIMIHGRECRVTASIGVAKFKDHGTDEQSLTKNADAAMYLAKEEGRSGFRFFSRENKDAIG